MIELAYALILLIGAAGTGHALLCRLGCRYSSRFEELCFAWAAGFGSLMLLVLILGITHLLYVWSIYTMVVFWAVIGSREWIFMLTALKQRLVAFQLPWRSFYFWLVLLVSLAMVFNLLRALAPPHGSTDPLAYQLALPKIYLLKHYLSFEPTVTGALYPSNMGLLYVMSIGLRNGILAQVLHWLMGVLTCLAIAGFARRYFSWQAGVWAAAIFSFLPILVVFGPKGYIDIGLCFFQFMAFWAVFNWAEKPSIQNLVLAAVLTGIAMGIKHQGLATLFIGGLALVGYSLHQRRSWALLGRDCVLYAGISLLLAAPWYVRSYSYAGNPVWPLANEYFNGAPYKKAPVIVDNASDQLGRSGLLSMIPSLTWIRLRWEGLSPWTWTFNPPGWQKAIGVYFMALIPGVILYLRGARQWQIAVFCLIYYLVLVRALHMNPRYGLVLFGFLSVLCGQVAARVCASPVRPLGVLFKTGFMLTVLANTTWSYAQAQPLMGVALGTESRQHFLQRHESNYRAFQFVNQHLPASSNVLLQGIVKGYYCERPYLWDHPYPGVVDYPAYDTPEKLLARMQDLKVSHVVRMIHIPPYRLQHFPQYFTEPFHEAFRQKYLKLIYRDESYVVFEVQYRA
jgi:hypothetical protein